MRDSLSPPSQSTAAGGGAPLCLVMMGGGRTAAKKILGELILNFGSGRVKKKGVVLGWTLTA